MSHTSEIQKLYLGADIMKQIFTKILDDSFKLEGIFDDPEKIDKKTATYLVGRIKACAEQGVST